MKILLASHNHEDGFSFGELLVVICGIVVIAGIGLPLVTTVTNSYSLVLAGQQITTQLQTARMKAVTTNESIRVRFFPNSNYYQVEGSDGTVLSGPFAFAPGVIYNGAVTFAGDYVEFLPNGNLPSSGNGTAGRVSLVNNSQTHIDVVVGSSGMIRMTPGYRGYTPPF
jgi:Tfp pilus assembly protein FimT